MSYSTCNYTTEINENECIGDSLTTINANFSALDVAACNLAGLNDIVNSLLGSISSLMNIRISLSNSSPIITTDITNTANIYIHPYNGSVVSLWNTTLNKWELKQFTSILPVGLAGLASNTNYDVYLYLNSLSSI